MLTAFEVMPATRLQVPIISVFQTLKITVRNMNTHSILVLNYVIAKSAEICIELLWSTSSFISLWIINLADDHRRDFVPFSTQIIETDLPHRWTSARFSLPHYTDRTTSPLNIGEILVASLYRQNYLAAEHRRGFRSVYKEN